MIWKVTYIYWCSVVRKTMYVRAETENEAWKIADSQFGYEEVDIKGVEPATEEEVIKKYIFE